MKRRSKLKTLGVVVEYNPFHNGHLYHIESAKKLTQPDVVIAVMSGNFLQRGEPALVNKWFRTKMALLGGVDIVIELPYRFATQKAQTFALGAVSILDALNCEALCFGSENGEINSFTNTLSLMENKQDLYQDSIKLFIKEGISYPSAMKEAFYRLGPTQEMVDLSKPNNILGYHYIEAIHRIKSPMKAFTLKRKNAEYHDEFFTSETIASATSIRKALFTGNSQASINHFVPDSTKELLSDYLTSFSEFHQWENYWPLLKFRLIQASSSDLKEIYEVEEGLENRLKKAAIQSQSFIQFMECIKTKRYTWTRLQRACLHILTGTKKAQMLSEKETPNYLRLLGMTEKGKKYLNENKKYFSLPLITKVTGPSKKNDDAVLDLHASIVYSLGLKEPFQTKLMQLEYKQPPIILNT
jgi:predicted nucleotidyltransferase